jgi:DnaJ-class molecular chaperone
MSGGQGEGDTQRPGDTVPPDAPGAGEALCPVCSGRGKVDGHVCANCNGSGKVTEGVGGA